MRYVLIFFLACYPTLVFTQKHDNIWLMGYGGGNQSPFNDSFGLTTMSFDTNKIIITNNQSSNLNFDAANSSIADSSGNLLFYSNAERVYARNHQLMLNGNNLNIDNQYGSVLPQAALALPYPSISNEYLLLVMEDNFFSSEILYAGYKVYYNLIDMNQINGMGLLVEKKVEIIKDTLEAGQMTAVKHANGRDWWVLVAESYSNRYYTLLLNNNGITVVDTQDVGLSFIDGLGQAVFSPDGNKYVRTLGIKTTEPKHLYIYDFDRCTGKLSNPVYSTLENTGIGLGCAFSPDSRYLYITGRTKIWQYDMHASDIPGSQTLIDQWDGHVHNNQFLTGFALAQLAPDGHIYISTPNSNRYLHTIEFPNRAGTACQVRQRAIHLPNYNVYGIPNHPNFRLGPLDDSPCDTLGLNNLPLANFRWDFEDTLSPLQVTFSDLSAYEPEEWYWDFGHGGSGSADTSPVHVFPAEGLYTVCLTVRNAYGADTVCYPVRIGTSVGTAAAEAPAPLAVRAWPNPFGQVLSISVPVQPWERVDAELFDALGCPVARHAWRGEFGQWRLDGLPSGVYVYRVRSESGGTGAGRVVKE